MPLRAWPASTASFPVPPSLTSSVLFWENLFTEYDSGKIVLHDRFDVDVVWQVITLPKKADGRVDESQVTRATKAAANDLRERLKRLQVAPTPIDDTDKALLEKVGNQPMRLFGAWQRVRCQRGVADHFNEGKKRFALWRPEILSVLKEEGVPLEVSVLPFVESMFNPKARSAVGAAGVWQLMPATARALGLTVNRHNDERTHVLKATRAAARMLKQNHKMLGSWPLAITAYNHGPNGVRRACQAVGSTDLADLIERYERGSWGFASKNFYAEFLAALKILIPSTGA